MDCVSLRSGGAESQVHMNIFQLYHLLIPATVNILMMGEERLIYKVDSLYPIILRLCPLGKIFWPKEILGHDPSSLKPAPLSSPGFRDTREPEMPSVPPERTVSPLPSFMRLPRGQPCFTSSSWLTGQSGCLAQGQPIDGLVNEP